MTTSANNDCFSLWFNGSKRSVPLASGYDSIDIGLGLFLFFVALTVGLFSFMNIILTMVDFLVNSLCNCYRILSNERLSLHNIFSVLIWLWNAFLGKTQKKHPGDLQPTAPKLPLHPRGCIGLSLMKLAPVNGVNVCELVKFCYVSSKTE